MAKLSKQEQAMLEKLNAKAEAPDAPAITRTLNASIDLGDPKQVALAQKHGFLDPDEIEEESGEGEGDDEGEGGGEGPRRRGYFDGKK